MQSDHVVSAERQWEDRQVNSFTGEVQSLDLNHVALIHHGISAENTLSNNAIVDITLHSGPPLPFMAQSE